MTEPKLDISPANAADLAGILALQAANQFEQGGTLSANLPSERILAMMDEMPLIVARRAGQITGFLMSSSRTMNADIPIIQALFAAYPGRADAYLYGPICVAAAERGKGVAQSLFAELRRLTAGREGVLFIRCDNTASLRAHQRMGMRELTKFQFNGVDFAVFSYIG